MSPNKRKVLASDTSEENDSFKHRRSSLRVNLSCDNLTDSGNGSLWRTGIENDERGTDAAQANRRLSRNKNTYGNKNRQFDLDNENSRAERDMSKRNVSNDSKISLPIKEGVQLKRLTINLEDISVKEQALEANCKRLKDAILNKTKQIFDTENELSIKTAIVFENEQNCFTSGIHGPNANKSVVMLDTTDSRLRTKAECGQYVDTVSNRQRDKKREDRYCNIIDTPTNSSRRNSSERAVDKSRLTQRRLFAEEGKKVKGQTKCRIIEDIVLKKNFTLLSLRTTEPNEGDSPILSGSNRRLSLLRARSKLRSRNRLESQDNTYSTIRSADVGAPIVCSTFIEDNATSGDKGDKSSQPLSNEVNSDTSCATHTTNKIISMEMTEIYGGIRTSEDHLPLQNRNLNTNNYIQDGKERKSESRSLEQNERATMQITGDVENPVNKLTVENIAHSYVNVTNDQDVNTHVDTVVPMQASIQEVIVTTKSRDALKTHEFGNRTKNQSDERRTLFLSDSSNTTRSSLNVNTSLDAMIEAGKMKDVRSNYKTNDNHRNFETATNNKDSIALDDESVITTRTSLQMNISIDSMRKTWQRRNNCFSKQSLIQDRNDEDVMENHSNVDNQYLPAEKNKKSNNVDSLENISLIERLRNISMQNQISTISEMADKEKARDAESNSVKCQNNERVSRDSSSYVEATPYPISRSVLIRSQLKHKTQNLDNNTASCNNLNSINNEEDNEEDNDKINSDVLHSKVSSRETVKTGESDTIILADTLSCDPFVTQNQFTVRKDTPDKTRPEIEEKNTIASQHTERIPVKKGKRRLLPLNENSQSLCSITPIEENKCTPEESTFTKRNKKLKKKRPKRNSAGSKNDASSIKRNIENKQTWSDSDYSILESKKKKDKKTRKPRKVVSKKIVIKKFADENVLNILKGRQNEGQSIEDQSIENRDSSNDFVQYRTTHWNKYKSHKIVIVTTGLSKGDKSLVRSIVKNLGTAEMELNVSRRTTHVVSTGVRTVNLLRGIIRGCWLITLEWVLKSLENNAWLNPEAFEMKHFSKAVQENRKDRQLFGPSYIPELFTACGPIYVEYKTTVPCDTLKELVKTAGGHITENIKLARIIIGENGLKETWIIDSITTGELQLTKLYQRKVDK